MSIQLQNEIFFHHGRPYLEQGDERNVNLVSREQTKLSFCAKILSALNCSLLRRISSKVCEILQKVKDAEGDRNRASHDIHIFWNGMYSQFVYVEATS